MKNRIIVPIVIFVAICLFIAFSLAVICHRGIGISEGLYLRSDSGSDMIIMRNDPIVMQSRGYDISYEKLNSGDKILILHDGVQESYPGGTGVYACIKLKNGQFSDIPEGVIDSLTELGWMYAKND